MTVTGVLIGGPANMISAAITADLGRQEILADNDQALSTVTGIVDGTGSFGAAIGQVFIPVIQNAGGWQFVFYLFIAMVGLSLRHSKFSHSLRFVDDRHMLLHYTFVHSRM